MRFEEAIAELDARRETRMLPDISRILRLATLMDDPQLRYPSIHVTGTNGKGTAARVAAAVACAHGLTAGLYTSPHLLEVTERFSVCGQDMTREEFAEEYEHLLPYLLLVDGESEDRVTYFEALTALGVPVVRRPPGGARRVRGRDGRDVGRHEPGGGRCGGHHADRARSPRAGRDDRRGGGGEERDHQAREDRGRARTGRRGHDGDRGSRATRWAPSCGWSSATGRWRSGSRPWAVRP